jgi:hypothetical protein
MMTRLVLVGMVAALGISVPTWADFRGRVIAAHSWTAHQLAEWDTSARHRADAIALPPVVKAVPRFEPIEVDELASSPADELNRFAEGPEIVPEALVARRRPTNGPAERPKAGPVPSEFSPMPGIDIPELKWMADLWAAADPSPGAMGAVEAPISARRPKARMMHSECHFTASVGQSTTGRPAPVPSVPAGSLAATVAPPSGRIEPMIDGQTDIAGELNRFGEGFEAGPSAEPLSSVSSGPRFEPIDSDATLDTGLAIELNRVSDGLNTAWTAEDHSGDPRPEPRSPSSQPQAPPNATLTLAEPPSAVDPSPDVEQAIRLTGEAVHAWMRLISGSAAVRVSVR